MDKYTRGEVAALVGPVMSEDPDNIQDVLIIIVTNDGMLRMKGPAHTPNIIGNIVGTCVASAWEMDNGGMNESQ